MIEKKMNLKSTTTTCRKPLILLGLLHFCRLLQKGHPDRDTILLLFANSDTPYVKLSSHTLSIFYRLYLLRIQSLQHPMVY